MDISFPEKLFTGRGLSFYVKGWIYCPLKKINTVTMQIGHSTYPMVEIKQPRVDVFNILVSNGSIRGNDKQAMYSGFSGCFDLHQHYADTALSIKIAASFTDGSSHIIDQRRICCISENDFLHPIQVQAEQQKKASPLVAICMATYNPDITAFHRQINSIRCQTYTNWICIVCDDGSASEIRRTMEDILAGDNRFYLIQHETNLGYYRNFERALCSTPHEAEYVAFSDQDDYWYPDKIERLANKIQEDRQYQLVYSDMRIVSKDGQTISETYWRKRKNHFHDIRMVMVCGTVTGAASLFKRDLLNIALPFTQNTGNAFHDHLISCAALAIGKIGYIDTPLYDYIQHDINVIGHHEFEDLSVAGLLIDDLKTFSRLKIRLQSLYHNYAINYIRLYLIARSLLMRIGKPVTGLKVFDHTWLSVIKLFFLHIRVRMEKKTTENAEVVIALSYIARKIYKFFLIPGR